MRLSCLWPENITELRKRNVRFERAGRVGGTLDRPRLQREYYPPLRAGRRRDLFRPLADRRGSDLNAVAPALGRLVERPTPRGIRLPVKSGAMMSASVPLVRKISLSIR